MTALLAVPWAEIKLITQDVENWWTWLGKLLDITDKNVRGWQGLQLSL